MVQLHSHRSGDCNKCKDSSQFEIASYHKPASMVTRYVSSSTCSQMQTPTKHSLAYLQDLANSHNKQVDIFYLKAWWLHCNDVNNYTRE